MLRIIVAPPRLTDKQSGAAGGFRQAATGKMKRPPLFGTTGSNPLHGGPLRGTLFLNLG